MIFKVSEEIRVLVQTHELDRIVQHARTGDREDHRGLLVRGKCHLVHEVLTVTANAGEDVRAGNIADVSRKTAHGTLQSRQGKCMSLSQFDSNCFGSLYFC